MAENNGLNGLISFSITSFKLEGVSLDVLSQNTKKNLLIYSIYTQLYNSLHALFPPAQRAIVAHLILYSHYPTLWYVIQTYE